MEVLNTKRDIEAATIIIENAEQISGSNYDLYSKIFNLPTLKHKPLFQNMNGKWDSFLGVLGSTDPMLNAVCKGTKKVVAFDINCLNVYFAYLKIAGVITLSYQEFLAYFYATNWEEYFCKKYYEKLKNNLPKDIKDFWDSLYEKYPYYKIRKLFFHRLRNNDNAIKEIVIPNNIFLEEKEYYKLKKALVQIKFDYYIGDLGEIPDAFKEQKFDVIYLSCMNNLIYDNVHGYNYFDKLKEYETLLKKDGIIQGGYFYGYQNDYTWMEYAATNFKMQQYDFEEINYGEDICDFAFIKSRTRKKD